MRKQINLIPSEMAVPVRTVKLADLLNKITTITVIVLILATIGMISFFVYQNIQYKDITANVESLKNKIITLEKNEQKLVLAKDKLSKIGEVKKTGSINEEIAFISELENSMSSPSGTFLSEIDISKEKIEATSISDSSQSLSAFLDNISKVTIFKKVTLSSLGYNQKSGFLTSLLFENK